MPGAAHADSTTSSGKSSLPSAQPSTTNRSKSSAENVYKQGVPLVPPQLRTFFLCNMMSLVRSLGKTMRDNVHQTNSVSLLLFINSLILTQCETMFGLNG
ncbi:unnamed protein product [Brassica rapa subsp. trilocularis]